MIWNKEIIKTGGAMMSLIPQGHGTLIVPQKHNATTTMVLVKLLLTLFSKKQTFATRQLRLGWSVFAQDSTATCGQGRTGT